MNAPDFMPEGTIEQRHARAVGLAWAAQILADPDLIAATTALLDVVSAEVEMHGSVDALDYKLRNEVSIALQKRDGATARSLAREHVALVDLHFEPNDYQTLLALHGLGRALALAGNHDAATRILQDRLDRMESSRQRLPLDELVELSQSFRQLGNLRNARTTLRRGNLAVPYTHELGVFYGEQAMIAFADRDVETAMQHVGFAVAAFGACMDDFASPGKSAACALQGEVFRELMSAGQIDLAQRVTLDLIDSISSDSEAARHDHPEYHTPGEIVEGMVARLAASSHSALHNELNTALHSKYSELYGGRGDVYPIL